MNLLAILLAGAANVVLGMIWYNPHVLGGPWMRMVNMTPEQAEKGKKRMPMMAIVGFLAACFMAWVMMVVQQAFGVYDWISAIDVGFWLWAGFVAPVGLGVVLWESKPVALYLINAIFWLVSILVMSVILVW